MRVLSLLFAIAWVVLNVSLVQAAPKAAREDIARRQEFALRQDIVQGLEDLARQYASFTQINRYLNERHAVVEDYCATVPEHRDCLQRPAVRFPAWESDTLRVLSYVLRMEPRSGTVHVTLICLRSGTGEARMQPIAPGGAPLAAILSQVRCGALNDEVEVDLVQRGDFRFGGRDAGTAKELIVDFPG